MSSTPRLLSYGLAINEALHQLMESDESVCLIGQGVKSPWYVGNTTIDLQKRFGVTRVIDSPVSENAITGVAVGAAVAGLKPIVVHPRVDFMMYAMDPIINEAANWHYMFGGASSVPMVIWGIINRGGEQAAQHSQALHALFSHIPGLKVVIPTTAYDAKGLLVAAVRDRNPVVFIDDRWLYKTESDVPIELYEVPLGKGIVRRAGSDVTVVAISAMVTEALIAADELAKSGVHIEVIDPRSLKPFDEELVVESLKKTGRLLVCDTGWQTAGMAAAIISQITQKYFSLLKSAPRSVTLPDTPAPMSGVLEKAYFKTADDIIREIRSMIAA